MRLAPPPRRQRGLALVVILAVLVMFALYAAVSSLSDASVRVKRDQRTRDVLLRAKEALIGYAASDVVRPGELPCPDVNDDGKLVLGEDIVGSACASLVGRLPWATLGLPDLRDDAGERLWYALSNDFHANGGAPLNNETAYLPGNTSLTIAGASPAANVVAVVFSPGVALTRADALIQSRSCTAGNCDATGKCISAPPIATPRCNPVNYLDSASGVDNADLDVSFVAAAQSTTFNDRLLPIFSDDIMSIVQRRAGRELAQKLREHFTLWQNAMQVSAASRKGFYPYAAPLTASVDPSVQQPGANGTTAGLLPVGDPGVVWQSASIGGGFCLGVGTAQINCTALVLLGIGGNVTGSVAKIGGGFVQPPDGTEMTTGGLVLLGAPSASPWTLNSGTDTLDFSAGISFLGTGVVTVTVRAPNVVSSWVNDSTYWVSANQWYQDTYYAVSGGYTLSGASACGATPPCVTLGNTAAPTDDKRALVVMTGRNLAGQRARPPTNTSGFTASDYVEEPDPASLVFARDIRSPNYNDDPIVVLP